MSDRGPEIFGAFVMKMRKSRNWSQHQLGQKVDARSSYVTSVENGETWPADHFIDQCAWLFGVPHEFLYAMLGPKPAVVAEKRQPI